MAVSTTGVRAITTLALLGAFAATLAKAHEHHDEDIPEGQVVSPDPIVRGIPKHGMRRAKH